MSGFAMVIGSCCLCGAVISFHPHKVPSVRPRLTEIGGRKVMVLVADPGVPRQPLCEACAHECNRHMPKPIVISPEAYDPCPVEEL